MASPPRDGYRFHPAHPDKSLSPRDPRSPGRSQSLHSVRSPPKSRPSDYRDPAWYPPPTSPYGGGGNGNEWQVRDRFDGPSPPSHAPYYAIDQPYTPPLPVQSPPLAPHHNSSLLLQAQNADYFDAFENQNEVDVRSSRRHLDYEPPADVQYDYEYQPSYRELPGPPHQSGPPHQPVHSQTYRSPANNASYNQSVIGTNNGFYSEPPMHLQQPYPPQHPSSRDVAMLPADDSRNAYRVRFSTIH